MPTMQLDSQASVPFSAKLAMLQAHLNGMDEANSAQAAAHLRTMTERLRRLAGELTQQRRDRFDRLEALIACYHNGDQATPLELQIWCEKQLQVLVPYLGGGAGRTPPSAVEPPTCSGAASSTDVVVVNDSVREDVEVPEYRVRRSEDGDWEPATAQEAAEFRAHDEAIAAEQQLQANRDEENYQMVEAAMQQSWDDWAMRSELDRAQPLPSRKRIRVVLTVGSQSGVELGGAEVVGTIEANQIPVVSFRVEETVLGGVEGGAGVEHSPLATAAHAAPQLAHFDPECLPGLSQDMIDIMSTKEARHWLHLFSEGLTTKGVIIERLGVEVSEVFEMWVAVQQDNNDAARNCGELVVARADEDNGEGQEAPGTSTGSEVSTVDFDKPALPLVEHTASEKTISREQGEAAGEVNGAEEAEGVSRMAEAAAGGGNEESQAMDVEMESVDNVHGNEGQAANDMVESVDACVAKGKAEESTEQSGNGTGSLPTAGLASRLNYGGK